MIIDCISDLHGSYPELEGGDLLIIAGDLTARDKGSEYATFLIWLYGQKYKKKVVVCGNHDKLIYKEKYHLKGQSQDGHPQPELIYLQDSGTEFEGLKIWGSPWTKFFHGMNPDCDAFTCHHDVTLAEKWQLIPEDTDILITHTPPYGYLDRSSVGRLGCQSLTRRVKEIKPKLHVFGHIHEGYGVLTDCWDDKDKTYFVNAAHMNIAYEPMNKPIKIEL